jgi:SOS-response transcriptional repressor LexA|uniref:Putative DNA binding, helix-turn-helix domain containing protein n=2 Tax=viral metagenome TaxID=1070528 RepID=A0A6M3JC06_9ZZZZ
MDDFFRTGTFRIMSLIDKKALMAAMEDKNILAAPLALMIGRDKDYIRDYLKGRKKSLKVDDAQRIADVLKIPLNRLMGGQTEVAEERGLEVMGKVAAGIYKDISVGDQDEHRRPRIAVARDLRFPHCRQYALEIEGDSMDELFHDGAIVVCVDFADSGLDLKPGMVAHIERSIAGGQLVENTLKELRRDGKEGWSLHPRSTNPSHKPILLSGSESDDVKIRGFVVGQWQPLSFGF